jgi:hypothetical protein
MGVNLPLSANVRRGGEVADYINPDKRTGRQLDNPFPTATFCFPLYLYCRRKGGVVTRGIILRGYPSPKKWQSGHGSNRVERGYPER